MRTLIQLLSGLALIGMLCGCSSPSEPRNEILDLSQPWKTATPAAVGIDEGALSQAVAQASAIPRFLSLLVVRHEQLALEAYFHGNHRDSLNDVRSVTKSIISTLVGVALKEGFIGSLDETLADHIHPHVEMLSPALQAISIRHLLTMTGGFQWDELDSNSYSSWINSADHIKYLLDQPLVNSPGSTFTYNSAAVHLLGVLLQEAVGMPLPAFADEYLFRHMGIHQRKWEELTRGYVNGGAGIDLRPRDLARLGQFYLQGGASGEQQLLPAGWVDTVTRPHFQWRSTYGALQAFTYGNLWWVEESPPAPAFFAWGYGGQYVYVVPARNLVVVATTDWRGLSQEGGPEALETAVLDIIINGIIPAAG